MKDAKVVFLHGLHQRIVEAIVSFNPAGFTTTVVDGKSPEEQQMEAVKDADFIMVFRAKLTERILRSARKARLVQLLSAGYDSMNLKLLRELKIPCANNGGANSWAVADHAVLAMLSLYRRLAAADRAVREGRWSAAIDGMNTFEMANKVVGMLGFGNIGQKVARRVQAFDATVQYHDKFPLPPERERELKAKRVSLEELFRTSDIITCHAPLTNETRHVVNRQHLAMMKPTAVLINTSRGPVVDEAALHRGVAAEAHRRRRPGRLREGAGRSRQSAAQAGQRGGVAAQRGHHVGHLVPPRRFRLQEHEARVGGRGAAGGRDGLRHVARVADRRRRKPEKVPGTFSSFLNFRK